MDLKEARGMKHKIEAELTDALNNFIMATGLEVEGINLDIDRGYLSHAINRATLDVKLGDDSFFPKVQATVETKGE